LEEDMDIKKNEIEINNLVDKIHLTKDAQEKKDYLEEIFEMLKPFRHALVWRFAKKGVDFDDIIQEIDLKLIEAIYDYDKTLATSAFRHLVSKTRNGIWNYYRKEMHYFNETRSPYSIEGLQICIHSNGDTRKFGDLYDSIELSVPFNEKEIIEKIILEEELEKLSEHQKEVLLMYFVDDMKQCAIAEELDINQANVSRAKKRGIDNIKESIKFLGEQNDEL
jgi:RNA polymerase sigma factor (sigma-70 family)